MSSTKNNRETSQKIVDTIIEKLNNSRLSLQLIQDIFRHGFYRELQFENKDYYLQIGFSIHPLDYPNTFDIKYQNKNVIKGVTNKYQFLHELIETEPMDLYLYSDKSVDNLIFYVRLVDESKDKFFK